MNKIILIASIFIFFIWVQVQQHNSAKTITPDKVQKIRLETRARAIQSGGYDYNADYTLFDR